MIFVNVNLRFSFPSDVLKQLISWVRVGLNLSMALRQPQPGYKIRHIKVGVRLVEVLCMCSGALAELLILNEGIHERLLQLYHQDCMSLSIRLMILRALDASLHTKLAVEHFLVLRTSIPRVNGLKLADRVKAREEKLQVINKKPLSEGGNSSEFVLKPCDNKELESTAIEEKYNSEDIIKDCGSDDQKDVKCSNQENVGRVDEVKVLKVDEENMQVKDEELVTVKKSAILQANIGLKPFEVEGDEERDGKETGNDKSVLKAVVGKHQAENCKVQKIKGNYQWKKVIVNMNGKKSVRWLRKRVEGLQAFDGLNGYQALLLMFKAEKLSRTKFAICNLLRKLHVYEALDKFKKSVKAVVETNHIPGNCDGPEKKQNVMESYLKSVPNSLASESVHIDLLVACLTEITTVYQEAPLMLAQPKRFLPGHAQFDLGACSIESQRPYPALFAFFECHNFLECCNVLLTSPLTVSCGVILGPLYKLLKVLADSQEGLQYLATHVDATNVLLRILLQQPSGDDLLDESTISSASSQYLGLCIAYRLQALHFIDQILEAVSNGNSDPERQEIFENLLGLYYLTFTTVGKISITHVLSSGDFMKVLLDLATYSRSDTDSKYRKYPGKNFIDDLIVFAVKFGANGLFLRQFGVQILKSATNLNSKLQELVPYLKVLENPLLFSYDDISPLCDIIKRNIEQTAAFPGELVTALRILKHLAVPSQGSGNIMDNNANYQYSYLELKHKYVVLEFFALDGVSHITGILSKICEAYEQPAMHVSAFLGMRGATIMSIILPALALLRQMLTLVIQSRNTDFRDLTAINVLLQTYTLLNAFPSSAFASESAQQGCREVIETLLAYTQPVQPDSLSETEGLNKSLWTLMMSEVLKYITTNAHTFMSGLRMLSELLPLPLPVQTRTPLPAVEIASAMNSRKLWCAHLHSLSSTISDLISTLCGSACPALLQLLRRVCVQLADLAAPTALVVARSVLDGVSVIY